MQYENSIKLFSHYRRDFVIPRFKGSLMTLVREREEERALSATYGDHFDEWRTVSK